MLATMWPFLRWCFFTSFLTLSDGGAGVGGGCASRGSNDDVTTEGSVKRKLSKGLERKTKVRGRQSWVVVTARDEIEKR